jgi:hypothetical protein
MIWVADHGKMSETHITLNTVVRLKPLSLQYIAVDLSMSSFLRMKSQGYHTPVWVVCQIKCNVISYHNFIDKKSLC